MKIKTEIKGFRELERALAEELPRATAKAVLNRTAINASKRILDRARQLAPVERGTLRDGIVSKPAKARRQRGSFKFERSSGVEILTGPTGRPEGGNPSWQEHGTVKMPAHPFMRPAADSEGQAVIAEVKDELTAQIEKAKDRIRKKAARGK